MEIMDEGLLRIWPLKEVADQQASDGRPIFADYLLDSWCFRLHPISPRASEVYVDLFDGQTPQLVANSVLEFLELYEHDPKKAHAW